MAERPDLEYWVPILAKELTGLHIGEVSVGKPVVLRQAIEGELGDILQGKTIDSVVRHGNFIDFRLSDDLRMIVSCMLAGRFEICASTKKRRADTALSLVLSNETELRYRDKVQMGKVYICRGDNLGVVPGFDKVGLDVLDRRRFSESAFMKLAKKRRDQVRVFLMDKAALDSLGNAYADEVLFAAGIHPKTWTRDLGPEELRALYLAINEVIKTASDTIKKEKPPLDTKLRDFLKVRNRHKKPCPVCETPIRKAGVRGYDSFFCPQCQPATRKTAIVDWRKGK